MGRRPSRHGRWRRQPGSRRWWSTATSAGFPSSLRAVIDQGFKELDTAFSRLPVTDDPIADLALQGLTCRRVARENPHLYDLMFGLSTRGSYRPLQCRTFGRQRTIAGLPVRLRSRRRSVRTAGEVRPGRPHRTPTRSPPSCGVSCTASSPSSSRRPSSGSTMPVRQVLLPLGVNVSVGLGDTRERAEASHQAAARLYASIALEGEGRRRRR